MGDGLGRVPQRFCARHGSVQLAVRSGLRDKLQQVGDRSDATTPGPHERR